MTACDLCDCPLGEGWCSTCAAEASAVSRDAYPSWVCLDCGDRHGRRSVGIATWHMGTCDVCGEAEMVTEPRDFGHLRETWRAAR